jgi:creatinine amidohydrolase
MDGNTPQWRRYQELRPDQLREIARRRPIAFWPLGLLEHHGWHLPLGLDGLKAEHICIRVAQRTGGVLLPTMWWGAGISLCEVMWTLCQPEHAAEAILVNTVEKLVTFGFRVIVLLAGHYPWRPILNRHMPDLQRRNPETLFLWGTEMEIGGDLRLPGDHAAREETSYGLALFPELVDLDAMRSGRDSTSAWPPGQVTAPQDRRSSSRFDPGNPLFAQQGEDARSATRERGEAAIARLVEVLVAEINAHLSERL